jgi:hypothetical protein
VDAKLLRKLGIRTYLHHRLICILKLEGIQCQHLRKPLYITKSVEIEAIQSLYYLYLRVQCLEKPSTITTLVTQGQSPAYELRQNKAQVQDR